MRNDECVCMRNNEYVDISSVSPCEGRQTLEKLLSEIFTAILFFSETLMSKVNSHIIAI